jgi:DNA ligase-1
VVNTRLLRQWASEEAKIPLWLFENTYHIVGDLAETIALVTEPNHKGHRATAKTLAQTMNELIGISRADDESKRAYITAAWKVLSKHERLVFNKLITGGFRMGVSARNLTKALALFTEREANAIAHRLMGDWSPQTTTFDALIAQDDGAEDASRPYPFFLAYPIEGEVSALGNVGDYLAEDKYDGIRGQIIKRDDLVFVWSRGEELVTDKYPELVALGKGLPNGTVLDGEIVCHNGEHVLPFATLQTRIGRKTVTKKLLTEAPVKFIVYDLLEHNGQDVRNEQQAKRRVFLCNLVNHHPHEHLMLSALYEVEGWDALASIRAGARERNSEGLMLKHKHSPYEVGRKRGAWWKWKLDPYTIDAVLIYGMLGHGRRANLHTDYTFAVWRGDELVPFTKAYSGLTDKEFMEVDRFIRQNTIERFGPVRSVRPDLVFELAFEGIARSSRHKSGVALRFPRMVRIRRDKPASEAARLEELEALLTAP